MQTIHPCLWFDDQAEEAVNFYDVVFDNTEIKTIARYGKAGRDIHGRAAGSVMTIDFQKTCHLLPLMADRISLPIRRSLLLSTVKPKKRWIIFGKHSVRTVAYLCRSTAIPSAKSTAG